MLRRAKMLFTLIFAPVVSLAISAGALAEEAGNWAVNMPRGVTSVSNSIYDIHMLVFWIVTMSLIIHYILLQKTSPKA